MVRRVWPGGVVLLLLAAAAPAADPPLLGQTEEQVRARFAPPDAAFLKKQADNEQYYRDRPHELEFFERDTRLRPPVVKQVLYGWKPAADPKPKPGAPVAYRTCLRVGFDPKGVVRAFEPVGGAYDWEMLADCRRLAGTGWKLDPEAQKVFPPIHNYDLLTSNRYIVWDDPGTGVKIGRPGAGPTYVKGATGSGFYRPVAASADRRAYTACDVPYDSLTRVQTRTIVVADADTFWAWALADLAHAVRVGREKVAPTPPPRVTLPEVARFRSNGFWHRTYEEALAEVRGGGYDTRAAERLATAVVQLVRHPSADLAPAVGPAELFRERYDQTLARQLIALVGGVNEPVAVKGRAAEVLGHLDDPSAIDPLIKLLGGPAGGPAAAALKRATGQDHGADPAAWKGWWGQNQMAVRRGYAARQEDRLLRTTVAIVESGDNKKVYHRMDCAAVATASWSPGYMFPTVQRARAERAQPCPLCKPVK